jgi:transposase-like protein
MSLHAVSDLFLSERVAAGDGSAFDELARRYRPLIRNAGREAPGLEREDARQEALIGLYVACVKHDPTRGHFPRFAQVCVRTHVNLARVAASARKHLVLTEAVHDRDDGTGEGTRLVERLPAGIGADPAITVEMRDGLRERADAARRKANAIGGDLRRRYTDDQVALALALIADGRTHKEAAWAVGAPRHRVARWVTRAGARHRGRRRYTASEKQQAVALVHDGATLRQAGNAVGASDATVLRWVRAAA